MNWSPRQARYTLLLFLLIFAAGQMKAYLTRPVYPHFSSALEKWPPDGYLVDTTAMKGRALRTFPSGTTIGAALHEIGFNDDPLGSGHCLPRAGILINKKDGWRIRPMTQRERWVWRIPMDLYRCEPWDLQRISGIGPSLAGRIYQFVQERGFLESISELDEVPGVGPGKLSALKKDLALN